MAIPVIMPRQGQSVETCIITKWVRKKGDSVKTGDILFEYETDKASFEAEAQKDGVLLEIFYKEGDEVPVLTNVAVIGKKGEPADVFRPHTIISEKTETNASVQGIGSNERLVNEMSAPVQSVNRKKISPRARTMALKLGIVTEQLKGTGPNGRIIVRDIETAGLTLNTITDVCAGKATAVATQPLVIEGEYTDRKLSNIRKLISRSMHESVSQSAQLTHHMSADVRRLLNLRNIVKTEAEKGSKVNITLNDMICFTVIRALEKFPEMNSHFLGDSIRTFKNIHLGIAVDTPRGLMVPCIKDADTLSLKGLSVKLREVADQCRKGTVNPDLLAATAATFTVSNLGNYGVEMFTPIINLPQAGILGVNTIIYRPADLGNGVFGFIPVIGLSLTYDHRAVDGGPATLFLREIKNQIENFEEKYNMDN